MALSETAVIRVNADHAQARALFQAIGDGFDRLERKTERVNRKTTSLGGTIKGMAMSYASWQVAVSKAIEVVNALIDRHVEKLRTAAEKTREFERIATGLAVQGNLADTTDEEILGKLSAIAHRNAATIEFTGAAATELISQGFSGVLDGRTTDAFIQGMHALNASGRGASPQSLAQAVSAFMTGTGQAKTAENLAGTMTMVHNLFRDTPVQAADLQHLGGQAAPLSKIGNMSPEEILAAFSVLRETGPAAPAATALSSLVTQLASASKNTEVQKALADMKLRPTDVDFVGEGFTDVLGRLQGGLESLPEEARGGVAKQLMGKENVDELFVLLAGQDKIRQRTQGLGERASFEAAVRRVTSGLIAEETRGQIVDDQLRRAAGIEQRKADIIMQRAGYMVESTVPMGGAIRSAMEMAHEKFGWTGGNWLFSKLYDTAAESRPPLQVEFVTPTGTRVPGTMQRKQLNNGY